ncbi:transcription termination factor NusA [Gottfriedia acidiceleris]|uniref:transcription termination factor NusA n=1 Tax=Gottfriedia acidiceleris TaxID=371036 RepID=UPI002FFE5F95
MSSELLTALEIIEREKGISKDVVIEAIEAALISAYKRNFNQAQNVRVDFNLHNGSIRVFARKEIVSNVFDTRLEITVEEAQQHNPNFMVGDIIELEVTPKDFGRVAATTAKQVVTQRVREAERGVIYSEYIDRQEDMMTGTVQRIDSRAIYVNLGKIEAVLPVTEQIPTEKYRIHDRIKVFVTKVEKTSKGPQIFVSRTHPGLLKRLFETEVPEIYDGVVEIRSVAREAGDRSKISVYTSNPDLDPVGACVGQKGQRVQSIVNELKGEKIDIVRWSSDPVEFVANGLSPSQVIRVLVNEEEKATTVVVPDHQLSLAIGKRGQNARLAARLTGWKIDIKSQSDADKIGIDYTSPAQEVNVSNDDFDAYADDFNEE